MQLAFTGAVAGPAFVPTPCNQVRLRGVSVEAVPKSGAGAVLPLGCAAVATFVATKHRRQPTASARRFFGSAPPPPPKKAGSYKDFQDPWLGSADLGFDPLNLAVAGGTFDTAATAVPETTYYNYRESEVKHGRFAMAAFLAIFFETADREAVLRQIGQAPANLDTLDGTLGLDEVQAPVLLLGLGIQAFAEYNLQSKEQDGNFLAVEYQKGRIPGDLGFDPLKFGTGPNADIKGLHNTEVNIGRLAMIGVTAFLGNEFIFKDEVVLQKVLSDSNL
jgi:hypothetical protein